MSLPERARPVELVERAHLRDTDGFGPPVHRYAPTGVLAGVVRRFWVPVWSLPPGERSVQRVLQYPVCLVVVADDGADLVGPTRGLSTKELAGTGWAVGAMMRPSAGWHLAGRPVRDLVDGVRDLESADPATLPAARLVSSRVIREIRETMAPDPTDPARRSRAVSVLADALADLSRAPDPDGALVDDIVDEIERDSELLRVRQVCDRFALTERGLQRLLARRVGLGPKWLIQRRRLHEAAQRLRAHGRAPALAQLAADLGYSDQAHFSRDFATVTGTTPSAFAATPHPPRQEKHAPGVADRRGGAP